MTDFLRINLLSRQKLYQQGVKYFYLRCGLCVLLTAVVMLLFYAYFSWQVQSQKIKNQSLYQSVIQNQQQFLPKQDFLVSPSVQVFLMQLNELTPKGIYIEEIIYNDKNQSYVLKGRASSLLVLNEWEKNLSQIFQIDFDETELKFEMNLSKREKT